MKIKNKNIYITPNNSGLVRYLFQLENAILVLDLHGNI